MKQFAPPQEKMAELSGSPQAMRDYIKEFIVQDPLLWCSHESVLQANRAGLHWDDMDFFIMVAFGALLDRERYKSALLQHLETRPNPFIGELKL